MRQIGAHEDDTQVRPGRVKGELDGLTGVKSDPGTRDLFRNSTLIHRPSPPHGTSCCGLLNAYDSEIFADSEAS
jgi:hypothetical protein